MTPGERGFLLLTSHLGDPQRRPLTSVQLRTLAQRVRNAEMQTDPRELVPGDLLQLGYGEDEAVRIVSLLDDEELLEHCLRRGQKAGCVPLTRLSEAYPRSLRLRLGSNAPGCLWAKGDLELLNRPKIALVGSRKLLPENRWFARQVGTEAARQGFVLVSGNAPGADRTAQDACIAAGGQVISVVADELRHHTASDGVLYLSEDGFDLPFSAIRALSRNRIIHALGQCVLVAQSTLEKGGTWDGTIRNLKAGWSPVACFDDGRDSTLSLAQMGAQLLSGDDLSDFDSLTQQPKTLFDL